MPDYALLKTLHLGCAVLSISGFAARLALMISGSAVLRARLVRVLPHVVDTVLLASALAMVWLLDVNPLAEAWLAAKIVALVAYVLLGVAALRAGRTLAVRVAAGVAALAVAGFIVSVAVTKSAWGFLAA
ncbi:MAG TPA: SirB2 family protein [Burkholderiaceae bacterium]